MYAVEGVVEAHVVLMMCVAEGIRLDWGVDQDTVWVSICIVYCVVGCRGLPAKLR